MLTSSGSFFTSAVDLMVLVFWSEKTQIIMFWCSWRVRVSERQQQADDLPARLLVSPAAVWFCLPVLSVCLQMSACLSSGHHMANSVSAQEHHTWTQHTQHEALRNIASIIKRYCRDLFYSVINNFKDNSYWTLFYVYLSCLLSGFMRHTQLSG